MMTQFFQLLKPYPQSIFSLFSFMMTQFFQVLKREKGIDGLEEGFMMTQFFQVLKLQLYEKQFPFRFYDDSILPGTKTSNHIFSKAKIFLTYYHHLVYYSIYTVCIKAFSKLFFILYLSKCIPIDSFNNLRKTYSLSIGVYNSQPI